MLGTGQGLDMKHQNAPGPVGSECDVAYFVLQFVPGARQIISQLVRNETTKTLAFVVCGGGCRC